MILSPISSFLTDVSFRTLTALALIQSALMHGGLLDYYYALWIPSSLVAWPPQLYRLVTPFLLTSGQLQFIFDLYFSMMPCCIGLT
jgi:hypothetical protein